MRVGVFGIFFFISLCILSPAKAAISTSASVMDAPSLSDLPGGDPAARISLTGFIATALNHQDLGSLVTGLVAEGGMDLFSLQIPIEYFLEASFRGFIGDIPGMPLAMSQFKYSIAAKMILYFYSQGKQPHALDDDETAELFLSFARQMEGLRAGMGSDILRAEIINLLVRAAPAQALEESLAEIERCLETQSRVNRRLTQEASILIKDMRVFFVKPKPAVRPQTLSGKVVMFAFVKIFQKTFAVPVALLHLAQGTSLYVSDLDIIPMAKMSAAFAAQTSAIPSWLVNEAVSATYSAVSQFGDRLKRDREIRYPGPSLHETLFAFFKQLHARYKSDLAKREIEWAGGGSVADIFPAIEISARCETMLPAAAFSH